METLVNRHPNQSLRSPEAHRARITRLRVFGELKRQMLALGECPIARDVAVALGMSESIVCDHMRALDGADGLPFSTEGRRRVIEAIRRGSENLGAGAGVVPVDRYRPTFRRRSSE